MNVPRVSSPTATGGAAAFFEQRSLPTIRIDLAKRERLVLRCEESVPWRCHRSLSADALLARAIEANEITSGVRTRPHELTPWAQVKGTRVTYPDATHGQRRLREHRRSLRVQRDADQGVAASSLLDD